MPRPTRPAPSDQAPGRSVWLVLGGIVSVQVGAAFSKQLFAVVAPTAIVWLRILSSTVVLLLVARPRLSGRSLADWRVVGGFGLALAVMNWSIYQSFARIPLGVAVTVEFLGPLSVALLTSHRAADVLWVVLAGLGVALLGWQGSGVNAAGVGFALLAGAAWAAYILLSAATGRRWPGLSGLALAGVVGSVGLAPFAVVTGGADLLRADVLAVGALVGLLSSVIPYSLELAALRTMPPKVFGILMSLEPAAAALVGLVVLGELLAPLDWLAVGCVMAASIGVTRSVPREALPKDA